MRICDWSSDLCSSDLLGEGNETFQRVIAVRPPPGDLQGQVHLGPRLLGDGRAEGGVATDRHARHRGYMFSGGMVTPSSSFFSMSGNWSSFGSRLSARCHWKRASSIGRASWRERE